MNAIHELPVRSGQVFACSSRSAQDQPASEIGYSTPNNDPLVALESQIRWYTPATSAQGCQWAKHCAEETSHASPAPNLEYLLQRKKAEIFAGDVVNAAKRAGALIKKACPTGQALVQPATAYVLLAKISR